MNSSNFLRSVGNEKRIPTQVVGLGKFYTGGMECEESSAIWGSGRVITLVKFELLETQMGRECNNHIEGRAAEGFIAEVRTGGAGTWIWRGHHAGKQWSFGGPCEKMQEGRGQQKVSG